jgi:acyl carrier protein
MDSTTFYTHIAEIADTDASLVNPSAELESLGWSSLAVISFIAFADENFGVILDARKIATCKTVGDLMQLLDDKVVA